MCMRKAKAKENKAKLMLELSGIDGDQEPFTPTNGIPDE